MNNNQYNPSTFENDFAILKLDSPLELNDDVKPACLPTSSELIFIFVKTTVLNFYLKPRYQ